VDPIAIGAAVVTELQRIVSREVDPLESAVVTVGSFHSGTKHNIIARKAELQGTIRALSPQTRELLHRRIREIATGVAAAGRATCDARINSLYPVTVNNEEMASFARGVARTVVAPEKVVPARPIMGSEDMSFFLNAAPGCFCFVGSANRERNLYHPHHSSLFDFDEACLPIGVELLSQLAITYLRERP
jgi:amidohydrolase